MGVGELRSLPFGFGRSGGLACPPHAGADRVQTRCSLGASAGILLSRS